MALIDGILKMDQEDKYGSSTKLAVPLMSILLEITKEDTVTDSTSQQVEMLATEELICGHTMMVREDNNSNWSQSVVTSTISESMVEEEMALCTFLQLLMAPKLISGLMMTVLEDNNGLSPIYEQFMEIYLFLSNYIQVQVLRFWLTAYLNN